MNVVEREDIDEILGGIDEKYLNDKAFLITGATGSLGRYCALSLCMFFRDTVKTSSSRSKVISVSRDKEKAHHIFREFWECSFFEYIESSVEGFVTYDGNVDYIIHAACLSATKFFYSNPVEILAPNLVGTYNLLNISKSKGLKGFLFLSSGSAQGGGEMDEPDTYKWIDAQNSSKCYAMGKAAGENLCAGFYTEYGIPAKIVRIGYTYGPHADIEDGHLYSDFIKAIISNKTLEIHGDGQTTMPVCYVTDAVRAFFIILFEGECNKPYYMVNYKSPMTIEGIAELLTKDVFKKKGLEYKCAIRGQHKDAEQIKRPNSLCAMGWEPEVDVADGFRRVVKYYECMES